MATRSRIGVRVTSDMEVAGRKLVEGDIIHVYAHWDGYPDLKCQL